MNILQKTSNQMDVSLFPSRLTFLKEITETTIIQHASSKEKQKELNCGEVRRYIEAAFDEEHPESSFDEELFPNPKAIDKHIASDCKDCGAYWDNLSARKKIEEIIRFRSLLDEEQLKELEVETEAKQFLKRMSEITRKT